MTYLFDNNISYNFAEMLRALDVDVRALREVFDQHIKDPDLLRELKHSNYVLVTAEKHMKHRVIEAELLKESGITALFIGRFWGKLGFWRQATWMVQRWPMIHGFASNVNKGTFATVQQNGKSTPFQI